MNLRLTRYKKEYAHSYSFGVFPTLELLTHKPDSVRGVVTHPKGLENTGVVKIQELCSAKSIPFEIQEKVFSRVGARNNDYAVGVFRKSETKLDPSSDHIILVNPSGMGNLGTILRTMLGFGFRDLAIIQPAADIFHPDAVRASMGALFKIRVSRYSDFTKYKELFPRSFYLLMTNSEIEIQTVKLKSPYGLVFGNESSGLPEEFRRLGTSVSIPQSKDIDSLNLAVSVGITLYQSKILEQNNKN